MKSYTDIEQSKKLAEILPLESADMHYNVVGDAIIGDYQSGISSAKSVAKAWKKNPDEFVKSVTPCWSLAALINALPKQLDDGHWWLQIDYLYHAVSYLGKNESVLHYILLNNEQLVDAVYKMIIWLKQNEKI